MAEITSAMSHIQAMYDRAVQLSQAGIEAANIALTTANYYPDLIGEVDLGPVNTPSISLFNTGYTVYGSGYNPPGDPGVFSATKDITVPKTTVFPTRPDTSIEPVDTSPLDTLETPERLQQEPPEVKQDFDFPDKPDFENLKVPSIRDLKDPKMPSINIPSFGASYRPVNIGDPKDYAREYASAYDRLSPQMQGLIQDIMGTWVNDYAPGLMDALAHLNEKIATDIEGGRGLSDEFERDLYNRARTRVENERVRNERQLLSGMTKRGFTLPAGAVSAGLQAVHQSASDAIAQQATEIAIERAKMEMQHVQFVMGLSSDLQRGLLGLALQFVGHAVQTNAQVLQYAEAYAGFVAKIFDHLVQRAQVQVEVYKAEFMAYETELKATLAQLDVLDAEVRIEEARASLNKAEVDVYTAQLQNERLKVEMYTAQLNAVAKEAEIENLKVEVYNNLLKAHMAQLEAVKIEGEIFKIKIDAKEVAFKAELARAEVYKAEIDGVASEARAAVAVSEASIATANAEVQAYQAKIDWYKAAIAGEAAHAKAVYDARALTEESKARSNQAEVMKFDAEYRAATLQNEWVKNMAEMNLKVDVANLESWAASLKLQAQTASDIADTFASMASAALSSQNAMISEVTSTDGGE